MKKLLLLSTLIAIMPFTANASNLIGPDPDNSEHPVIADAESPYQTAEITTADQAQVVSASYVKGAYNDTIAAINRVNNDKQTKIFNANGEPMEEEVFPSEILLENIDDLSTDSFAERVFASLGNVAAGIKSQRVTAVDTWGSNHTVDVAFKTVQ